MVDFHQKPSRGVAVTTPIQGQQPLQTDHQGGLDGGLDCSEFLSQNDDQTSSPHKFASFYTNGTNDGCFEISRTRAFQRRSVRDDHVAGSGDTTIRTKRIESTKTNVATGDDTSLLAANYYSSPKQSLNRDLGRKLPSNGRDSHTLASQSLHQPNSLEMVGELPLQIHQSPFNYDKTVQLPSLIGRGGELVEVPSTVYKSTRTPSKNSVVASSPPSLVDEEEGWILPLDTISSSSLQTSVIDEQTNRMKQSASPATESIGGSSMNSNSNASLFYFTAASTMSSSISVDTSVTSIDYATIEDRVVAVLKSDQNQVEVDVPHWGKTIDALLPMNRSISSLLDGDSWADDINSFEMLEHLDQKSLEARREEILVSLREEFFTIQPPINYKYKPIDSFFAKGSSTTSKASSTQQLI